MSLILITGLRAMRTNSGDSYHAIPAEGHRWIRAICGAAPGSRSAGWIVTGRGVTRAVSSDWTRGQTPTGGPMALAAENDRR